MKKFLPCLLLFFLFSPSAIAQTAVPETWLQDRQDLIVWSSMVLAAWAMGNIAVSSLSLTRASRDKRYFHQMNIIWNIVNLGLAGFGAYQTLSKTLGPASLAETLQEHTFLAGVLLLSTGLDVAYLAFGLYLQERAHRSLKPERLAGYGQSLVLQGTFLLFYDVVLLYLLHNQSGALYGLLGP